MALRVAHARDQRSASLPICRTALGFLAVERPGAGLLGHWEDFFVPIESPTKSVMLTDIGDFEARLRRVFDGEWWRPDHWTELRLPGIGA